MDSLSIQPYSDSTKAIGFTIISDSNHSTTKPMRPDYDITCHLHTSFIKLRAAIPLLANIQHIPGHSLEQPTTRQALLIIQVDKETKLERLRPRQSFSEPSPECPAYLISRISSREHAHTCNDINTCRWKWRNEILLKHYSKHFGSTLTAIRDIHWPGYAMVQSALPLSSRQDGSQWAHD